MSSVLRFSQKKVNCWPTASLSEVATVFTDGNWIQKKDQSSSGIRLLQTGNVGNGIFKDRREKARFIDSLTFHKLNCFEVKPDDILISRLPEPVGRACIVPDTGETMITAVDCTIVRINPEVIIPKFLLYYTQSDNYFKAVGAHCTGTTRRRISRKNLGKIPVPIPRLEEQKRIVAILDQAFAALDRAQANAEANLANAKELFENWIISKFSYGLENWPIKYLPDISENLDKRRIPISKPKRKPGNIPYYGASGIVDYVSEYLFDEELLLVSEDGANLLLRTYPIAFSISGKSWVNNHAHILRFSDFDTQEFVRLYLNSTSIKSFVSGAAQPKLNQKALNNIAVPFPDYIQRQKIVHEAKEISSGAQAAAQAYRIKLANITDLRPSLLQKAFAGELT